jgi:hypothetical protein
MACILTKHDILLFHGDERAYSNNNSKSNNHTIDVSHDEGEGENNNVNANMVQSASPTLVSRSDLFVIHPHAGHAVL